MFSEGDQLLLEKSSALIKLSFKLFQSVFKRSKDWRFYLQILSLLHNAKNLTAGYTPLYLTHGKPCLLFFDTSLAVKLNEPFVHDLEGRMAEACVLEKQILENDYAAAYCSKNRKTLSYNIADQVLLFGPLRKPGKSKKLHQYFHGPCENLKKFWLTLNGCLVCRDGEGHPEQICEITVWTATKNPFEFVVIISRQQVCGWAC